MIESEQTVIACCLSDAGMYDYVATNLEPKDFLHAQNKLIFEVITALQESGRHTDKVTVGAVLRDSKRWANLSLPDPIDYCANLAQHGASERGLIEHISIVRKSSVNKRLLNYSQTIADLAADNEMTAEQKLADAHEKLMPLADDKDSGFVSYGSASERAIADIVALVESGGGLSGISTGFNHLDDITSGLHPGELIILAGRPSMGKTAFAMNIVNYIGVKYPVDVFSLEMSTSALATRSLTSLGKVHFSDLRKGRLDSDSVTRLRQAKERMDAMDVNIDDRGGISVDELRVRARIAARQRKPALIVIDYLTQLRGKGENRTAEVGYVSRSLKAMAKELDCAVLTLAQLNRGVDSRADKRPTMSDLRDSGEIEQDADLIMFNYLDEKYDKESARKGILELVIAKQRNGETGSLFFDWQASYQTFKDRVQLVPPEKREEKEPSHKRNMRSIMGAAS